MATHAVVIAGGGPTGMMLAAELALAKVDVAIVERRPDHVLVGSRAGGFHSRTIEVLDQRGVADRFLAEGQVAQAAMIGTTVLDMSDFPTRHPYSLGIWQNQIERIMAAWIAELPVRIYYGCEVTGFAQDDAGVDVELSDGQSLRAQYLVGCDGGRSVIRRGRRHRVPGVGSDQEQPDRRGRGDRGTAAGHPPRRHRHPWPPPVGGRQDGARRRDRAAARPEQRAHPARPERGAHRRVRHRLRDPQSHVDLQVHRHDTSGRGLPRGTSPPRRRLGARALPGGRTGPQPRCAGCGESGMEAGAGGQRDLPGQPPRYVSGRAPPGRCPGAAAHDGPGRAPAPGRPHEGPGRYGVGAGEHGRASQTARRDHLRAGHSTTTSARATPCSDAACPIWTS